MSENGPAYKAGFCDAIFAREPANNYDNPFQAAKYEAGYKAGKESGACFPMPRLEETQGKRI